MAITPIADREAAKLLGVTYETIRNGVKRGALARIQKAGRTQYVAREQVMLFKGKRLLLGELTSQELKEWQTISDDLTNRFTPEYIDTPFTPGELEKANAMVAAFAKMYDALHSDVNQVLAIQALTQKKKLSLALLNKK